jgi:stearoyl-CoA desaturase (delta-9 desaturase)
MFTNISKSFWFQFIPAIMLGLITIGLLIVGIISPYYLIGTFIMWVLVSGLGIAVGYHRIFSHKTHVIPTWKENIILFFAAFAAQGASIFWVALHRGYHHPHADKEKDIHSPVIHGWLHAFVGWQYRITEESQPVHIKYSLDLLRKPNHLWFHKHQLKVLWGVPLLVAIFNWQLALTAFCLVSFIGVMQDNLVNVFGHLKGAIGYRNFETKDNSQNNLILGYLAWGQGWHNNHHHDPKSYDFGKGVSSKWWELDPSNIFLPFLNRDQY